MKNNKKYSILILFSVLIVLVSMSSVNATKNTHIVVDKISDTTENGYVDIKATIYDENNNVLPGKMIDFSVNGGHCNGHIVSDENGISGMYNYFVQNSGKNTVNVSFAGDSEYSSSYNVVTFNVISPNQINNTTSVNNTNSDNKTITKNTPKTSLKVKNNYAVSKGKLALKSLFTNAGPNKKTFLVYYKIPKGLAVKKPLVSKGVKFHYNKKTRILILKVENLKVGSKNSAKVIFNFKAKKGIYKFSPVIKTSGLKTIYNNKIKAIVKR
ncbi:hypothetical protein KQY27_06675 [Methanobrevibacter sp. TMH8]|uniref:hypothetical protein n=1 Tax=Methanobrevibacter sp. TMH8 TaxID=2848611 RepID=UPI001CCB8255|nr:hypothetical protein [Methanobrevibacter sp. TMH8]MBZ9571224.1 hypothetical protein [Methanobrevibacter sp. TMH8]